jgi:small subunit ribosomal protein S20
LRDREAGFRFEIMLQRRCPAGFPSWKAALALARVQDIFLVANTKSAKKAVRKIERRADVNRSRRSQMRTYVRKVEEAIAAGDPGAAAAALHAAQPLVMRAAQKGIVHAKAAARKVSRLSRRVNALSK